MKSLFSNEKGGLNIIIVGCGKVGQTLVEQLSQEGHYITVIDKDPSAVSQLTGLYDVMGIVGNGASLSIQKEAGIDDADLLIAVTGSDELNLLCCTVAESVEKCSTIARVRTPDYSQETNYLRERLGLAMIINPEYEASREATRILTLPTVLEINSFAHGHAELAKIQIPEGSILDGMAVSELSGTISSNFLICAVERNGEVHIPSGNFVLEKNDYISFAAQRRVVRSILQKVGLKTSKIKNVMIIGGGRFAYYLAKHLIAMGLSLKIIEIDKDRCEELSAILPEATIINGDGSDEELLKEEGITYTDAFVPLTGIDEENILLTLFAKKVSKAKVITKINRINFKEVVNSLELGSVIYPKYFTSETIIAYVRAKNNSKSNNIETLYHMFDSKVEAIEFNVTEDSEVTNVPLSELSLKKNLLVGFISRDRNVFIPSGNDCIKKGDTVMVVTTHRGFNTIEDILK